MIAHNRDIIVALKVHPTLSKLAFTDGKVVKPSYDVKVGDIVEIKFGDKVSKFEILQVPTSPKIVGDVIKIL